MFNFNNLIKLNYSKLTKQEKVVADSLIEYPRFVLEKNISNLALSINVSRNTITRFCKKLGFSGYSEFKYEYNKYLNHGTTIKSTDNNNLIRNIIDDYQRKLSEISNNDYLNDKDINNLAKTILNKNPLKIIGTGKSTPPALQLKYSLQTLGIYAQIMDSIYYSDDFSYLFNKNDIVLVYSVSGHSVLTNAIMQGAITKKAAIYMVTTNKNIKIPLKALFILPNVSIDNNFLFSNHTFFYIFNDILCNAIRILNK
ncbi:hypothetical protein DS832_06075 [Bombilactobacillus bombi]|uniref:MurR/RpiR family transcriptional regulator n=1 Tax=Bombilactobacillus bombi TaxID=1303590 RepID=A0A417Z6U7_9LACO|nr:MurR/RpiR family transcriptional regulator [Bombilactobacillus bombi]RHW46323.1 hypothetical protein DS832_06075 [Bombilactobacillus bombi]